MRSSAGRNASSRPYAIGPPHANVAEPCRQLHAQRGDEPGLALAMPTPGWRHAHQLAVPDLVLVPIVWEALEVGGPPGTGCRPGWLREGPQLGDSIVLQYPLSQSSAAAAPRPGR